MQQEMELQQIIYNLLKIQITFGGYRFEDSLPTIREASSYFNVSIDTVRLAYVRLKQEGYISLSTCVGASVSVNYSDEEIQQHIRTYFACRREPLLSFARAVGVLVNYAQWFAFRSSTPESLEEMERICQNQEIPPIFRMSRQIQLLYAHLGNDILLNLMWQLFLFFQVPFISVPQNSGMYHSGDTPLLSMIAHIRKEDWLGLWEAGEAYLEKYAAALDRFFEDNPEISDQGEPIEFTWNTYKKVSQYRYSLCTEIMTKIRNRIYSPGSYLPSPRLLARDYQVSVNTIRRTLTLLNKLGATRTVNGVGTLVLHSWENAQYCDYSDPVIRARLLDFLQSFHILALSCRSCARASLSSMDEETMRQWADRFDAVKQTEICEQILYLCYEIITVHTPWQLIRTIYTELMQQLFWGLPLRDLHGDSSATKAYFLPYIEILADCLRRGDGRDFSENLEKLQINETFYIAQYLKNIGIEEAAAIVIPE